MFLILCVICSAYVHFRCHILLAWGKLTVGVVGRLFPQVKKKSGNYNMKLSAGSYQQSHKRDVSGRQRASAELVRSA